MVVSSSNKNRIRVRVLLHWILHSCGTLIYRPCLWRRNTKISKNQLVSSRSEAMTLHARRQYLYVSCWNYLMRKNCYFCALKEWEFGMKGSSISICPLRSLSIFFSLTAFSCCSISSSQRNLGWSKAFHPWPVNSFFNGLYQYYYHPCVIHVQTTAIFR